MKFILDLKETIFTPLNLVEIGSLVLLISFLVTSVISIPLMIKLSFKFRVVDKPDLSHKTHVGEIPYLGGIGILFSVVVTSLPLLIWFPSFELRNIAVFSFSPLLILALLGLLDDLYKLSAILRLAIQILVSVFLVAQLNQTVYSPDFFSNPLIDSAIAVIWLVWFSNLLNMFDNHDGAASGVSAIIFTLLAVLAFQDGSSAIMIFSAIVAGALLGFMRFNWPPARIYLGDSGAMFVSFSAGIFFLLLSYEPNPRGISVIVPILGCGLLVLDFLLVVFSRIRRGVSPLVGDKSHSAHRLLKLGFSKQKVTLLFLAISALFAGLALTVRNFGLYDAFVWLIIASTSILSILYLFFMSRIKF